MKLRNAFLIGCALLGLGTFAYSQGGLFQGFPIVSNPSYCASTNNGVCTSTIEAGPAALTGNETIPARTNLPGGQTPQNVLIDVNSLGAGPYQYNAPVTGATLTLTSAQRRLIIEPAGTIAALTVVFPAATGLIDNQLMGLCSTQIVTTLTVTAGSGTTVSNAPTAMTVPLTTGAASCVEWVYRVSNTTWYRVQ